MCTTLLHGDAEISRQKFAGSSKQSTCASLTYGLPLMQYVLVFSPCKAIHQRNTAAAAASSVGLLRSAFQAPGPHLGRMKAAKSASGKELRLLGPTLPSKKSKDVCNLNIQLARRTSKACLHLGI